MEIYLVRHGRPTSSHNNKVTSGEFKQWVYDYNQSLVSHDSRPTERLHEICEDAFIVSSDLPRATDSARIATLRAPDHVSKLYREMDIPYYKLPFNLKAFTWVYLNRALWTLGVKGRFESYSNAKKRTRKAMYELITLAEQHKCIVVFSHGYFNIHLRKYMQKEGWVVDYSSNQYWGFSRLHKT